MSQNQKGKPSVGRPPKWFKDKCAKMATKYSALKFVEDCIDGEAVDIRVTKNGDVLNVPADAKTRAYVWDRVADRGYGKPQQSLEVTGEMILTASQIAEVVKKERKRRGLED